MPIRGAAVYNRGIAGMGKINCEDMFSVRQTGDRE